MSRTEPQLGRLKTEWNSCKAHDDQKNSLIRELFAYVDNLSSQLSDAATELQDKRDALRVVREQIKYADNKTQTLKCEQARRAFALVLIDGDSMPFLDEFVQQGLEGGKKAASLLKQAVEAELQHTTTPSLARHLEVVIRVYANMEGLAKIYKDLDVAAESTTVSFVRGFNMGHALCDFVDAGNGKECSDEKVKAVFRAHLDDVHCRRILFGGSTDGGYARLLESYIEYESVRERVVLIKGPRFAYELEAIKDRFRGVSFDRVFRSHKLPDVKQWKLSSHTTPPTSASFPTVTQPRQDATVNTKASKKSPAKKGSNHSQKEVPSSKAGTVTVGVLQNRRGERVDPPHKFTPQGLAKLKSRKLCNSFHLLGECQFLHNYGDCQHEHGAALSTKQTEMLRVIARQSPCLQGLSCKDALCLYGHRCTRSDCVPSKCRFSPEMHNVDMGIVQ